MTAILVISHGSRFAKTKEEVLALLKAISGKTSIKIIECAFLELESPSIPEGIDLCVQKGASEVFILLNFLNSGKHVDEDIPRIVGESQKKYPNVKIKITPPVGQHPQMANLFLDLLKS